MSEGGETAWAVETAGVTLIRHDGAVRFLRYPEAALWDLLSREVPLDRIVRITAAVAGLEPATARTWVRETIDAWVREGWLRG